MNDTILFDYHLQIFKTVRLVTLNTPYNTT